MQHKWAVEAREEKLREKDPTNIRGKKGNLGKKIDEKEKKKEN